MQQLPTHDFFLKQSAEVGARKYEKRHEALWKRIKDHAVCEYKRVTPPCVTNSKIAASICYYWSIPGKRIPGMRVSMVERLHASVLRDIIQYYDPETIYTCLESRTEFKHYQLAVCNGDVEEWQHIESSSKHLAIPDKLRELKADLYYTAWKGNNNRPLVRGLYAYTAKDCPSKMMRFFVGDPLSEEANEGVVKCVDNTERLHQIVNELFGEARQAPMSFNMMWAFAEPDR